MVRSLNTPIYALTQHIGADKVRATALDLGVAPAYGGRPSLVDAKGDPRPGRTRADIAIGRYQVSVADMAACTRRSPPPGPAASGTSCW